MILTEYLIWTLSCPNLKSMNLDFGMLPFTPCPLMLSSRSPNTLACLSHHFNTAQCRLRTSSIEVHPFSHPRSTYPSWVRNRYGLKTVPWCSPTSTPSMFVSPDALRTTILHPWYRSWMCLLFRHIWFPWEFHSSPLGMPSYVFSRSINTTLTFFCPSLCFSNVCFSMNIVLLPDINPNWLSCRHFIGALCHPIVPDSLPILNVFDGKHAGIVSKTWWRLSLHNSTDSRN